MNSGVEGRDEEDLSSEEGSEADQTKLRLYTQKELAKYDGIAGRKLYTSFKGAWHILIMWSIKLNADS